MMYPLSEEQIILRDMVRNFAQRSVDPRRVLEMDAAAKPLLEEYREIGRNGWLAAGGPEAFGGAGSFVDVVILMEEIAKRSLSLSSLVGRTVSYACPTISQWGSRELQEKFIPGLMAGEILLSVTMTEPSTGSDAAGIKTRARRVDGGYVLTGEKLYSSGAGFADIFLVSARTGADSAKGGVSVFIVDRNSPGITVSEIHALGQHSNAFASVNYNEVFVPEMNLLGELDGGWNVLSAHLERERISICAKTIGAMHAVLDEATRFAQQRIQFGKPIAAYQAIRHKLSDMATDLYLSRLATYDAAGKYSRGEECKFEAFAGKVFVTEAYQRLASHGVQIMGAQGYTTEAGMERHFRDSKSGTIGGGTSEILRNSIGKMVAAGSWAEA